MEVFDQGQQCISLKTIIKENLLDYVLEVMKRNQTLGQTVLHFPEKVLTQLI